LAGAILCTRAPTLEEDGREGEPEERIHHVPGDEAVGAEGEKIMEETNALQTTSAQSRSG
jgi:hypothetical protein